jgi:LPXTG-motif cell wall-anchored protein
MIKTIGWNGLALSVCGLALPAIVRADNWNTLPQTATAGPLMAVLGGVSICLTGALLLFLRRRPSVAL